MKINSSYKKKESIKKLLSPPKQQSVDALYAKEISETRITITNLVNSKKTPTTRNQRFQQLIGYSW